MKEVLNTMVQAMGGQAIAMGAMAEQVMALKRTLARQFPELADELKAQIEAEQEQNRTNVYDLQVSLGKLREAILQLPEKQPEARAEEKASAKKTGKRLAPAARGDTRTAARAS
jgi:hypothetical protein